MRNTDDFLEHYGVKGMRWGVRKDRGSRMGSSAEPRVTRRERKEINLRRYASARRRVLSDKDLDQFISRLEKEKKLKSLVKADLSPGKAAAQELMKNAGTKIAGTVLAGAGMYTIRGALTKNWSLTELASNIPKMKK